MLKVISIIVLGDIATLVVLTLCGYTTTGLDAWIIGFTWTVLAVLFSEI